jgi:hypothetical protein
MHLKVVESERAAEAFTVSGAAFDAERTSG